MEREWIDQVAQGEPEVVIKLLDGDVVIGLKVIGVRGKQAIGIREDHLGRPVSLVSTAELTS